MLRTDKFDAIRNGYCMSFLLLLLNFASSAVSRRRMIELGAQSRLLSLPVLRNSRGEPHFFTKFVSNQLTLY